MDRKLTEMTNEELWKLFPIILREHNPEYKKWYLDEQKSIIETIGKDNIERINHIGSTSVYGLVAKPTIDILLEITKTCDTNNLIKLLEGSGYIYTVQPDNPPPHMMFMKGYTLNGFAEKVYHLHIRYLGDWNEIYFRDYLQTHEKVADEYGKLKRNLKEQYEHDRDGYTNAKTEFITYYTKLARDIFRNRYKK